MIDIAPDPSPPPKPPTIVIQMSGKGQMNVELPTDLDLAEMMIVQVLQKVVEQRLAQKATVVQAVQGLPPPAMALIRGNGRR